VVEELSIRSIKLRDFAGTLHVIPFGAVTAASNMTRDFSYAVFEVNVTYDTSTDEAVECMREVDKELRTDRPVAAGILEPMEIVGLDKFGDIGIVIKARIKTRPAKQWDVMRHYNRLLKLKFDERGIAMPSPQRVVQVVQPRPGDPGGPPQHAQAAADPLEAAVSSPAVTAARPEQPAAATPVPPKSQ
jgi:moderate conductance mechanosensitive channel